MARQLPAPQQEHPPRRGETARELALLAIRRITSAPRLSAVLLIGALLAVGLASSAPIFIEAVRDLGLRQTLAEADPASLDLRVVRSNITANQESVGSVESVIETEAGSALGSLSAERMSAIRTGGFILRSYEQPFNPPDPAHATFLAQSDLEEASLLAAGRMPAVAEGAIEVVVESQQAALFGLDVGDERLAQPFWLGTQHETRVRIVGLVEPSTDERRWSTLDPLYLPVAARDLRIALLDHPRQHPRHPGRPVANAASDRVAAVPNRSGRRLGGAGVGCGRCARTDDAADCTGD